MFRVRFLCLLLVLGALTCPVLAAEVDCDATYCFSSGDFSQDPELRGICITALPESSTGTVLLGTRVLQPGDILTADQIARMTFAPLRREQDSQAVVQYLPIYENRVEANTRMTISIRGKEDRAPEVQDLSLETYKNLAATGKLSGTDPEGQNLTYTMIRGPKRGQADLSPEGTFTYTPKKNKVGVDSFTFTATDPAGNVSREATVTIQILKPTDSRQYSDTAGTDCRFEAEWLRNTGLFVGEQLGGADCFFPEKTVSRGEFLAMAVKLLEIPLEQTDFSGVPANTPLWLKPYLAAALRSGLLSQLPQAETMSYEEPITGAETAVLLQTALDLPLSQEVVAMAEAEPHWAAAALGVLGKNGLELPAQEALTRADAARIFYKASRLAVTAPGAFLFRFS